MRHLKFFLFIHCDFPPFETFYLCLRNWIVTAPDNFSIVLFLQSASPFVKKQRTLGLLVNFSYFLNQGLIPGQFFPRHPWCPTCFKYADFTFFHILTPYSNLNAFVCNMAIFFTSIFHIFNIIQKKILCNILHTSYWKYITLRL